MSSTTKFSNEDLTRYKKEINPAPIISKRVKLQREGSEYVGCCPDMYHKERLGHSDAHPSLKVYKLDDGTWGFKCFSCGTSGNVYQFVQKYDGVSFSKAVATVLAEAGVEGWQDGTAQVDSSMPEQEHRENVTFPLAQYTQTEAALRESSIGQKWITNRGISMETANRFHLGFVQDATAVCGTSHPWAKLGWVTFPTLSADGQVVTAVKYRSVVKKKETIDGVKISGILRAHDTATVLYNLQTMNPAEDVWVAEGEPDTLVLAQAGFTTVGYPMGGYKPTTDECDILSSCKRRFLAGDNDPAGIKAMEELQKKLSGATFVIRWPNNRKDANAVLNHECGNDPAKFKMLVEELKARATRTGAVTIEFHTPALPDPDGEYVVDPSANQDDGWFPLGDISLIGGASGTGKTTWIFELLHKQKQGWEVLGHRTQRRDFYVLAYDRGRNAFTRTMRRLNLLSTDIPTMPLPLAFGTAAVQGIINEIEKLNPTPNIIFIEGLDMLIDDANKKSVVSPFMRQLQEVAAHFHIALICSVGAPKSKRGEDYAAKRDKISGSEAWGRNAETVCVLEFSADDDGTAPQRELTILPRNAPAEKFTLQFEGGRLVPVQPTVGIEPEVKPIGRPNIEHQKAVQFLERELQDGLPKISVELCKKAKDLEEIGRHSMDKAADTLHVVKKDYQDVELKNKPWRQTWMIPPMHEVGNEMGSRSALIDYGEAQEEASAG